MFNVCLVTKQTLIVWASQAPVRDQAKDHRNVANTVIYRNKSQVLNHAGKKMATSGVHKKCLTKLSPR